MLIIKGLIGTLFQVALFAAFLFIPAGTWDWPRAIQFLAAYGVAISACTILLAIYSPNSLEARLEAPVSAKQPIADRIATIVLIVVMGGWFVFIPIDVFRLNLFPTPSLGVSVAGAVTGGVGLFIVLLAIYQNQFAVPVVRDQTERGQILVDTGLYGVVRHPMYSGLLLLFAGIGLWLESYASVIALVAVFASLVPRMLIEEKMLKNSLPGYLEHAAKVKYRLLPYVW